MREEWRPIEGFPDYSVSDRGRIKSERYDRILAIFENQFGVPSVGLMRGGVQYHRSVPLLVARAFLRPPPVAFDTPINLDGNRRNNAVENLVWRPRWFAIRYNQQFKQPAGFPIIVPIVDIDTGDIYENSIEAAKVNGLLESELIQSVYNHTDVWPTHQRFRILARMENED